MIASPIDLLGKRSDDPAVKSFMNSIGLENKKIKIKKGDLEAAFEAENFGVAINFSDASGLQGYEFLPEGTLIVNSIFMFDQGVQGHTRFQGELPFGLKFGETREKVRNILGAPIWSSPVIPVDRWSFDVHDLTVRFSIDAETMTCAIVHIK